MWNNFNTPRYAFYAWLILKERLLTKDRMLHFNMHTSPFCLLCQNSDENHAHLFCSCPFSRKVLDACPIRVSSSWIDICNGRCLLSQADAIRTKVAYLFIAAAFYHIWMERNLRFHNPAQYTFSFDLIRLIQAESPWQTLHVYCVSCQS